VRLSRQAYGIVEVEAHPTIEHQPEVIADPRPHLRQFRQILFKAGFTLGGAVMKREFATDEAERLGEIGARTGRVEWLLGANRPAEQVIDGLAADLTEQIPEREIDARNGVNYQSFATVVLGCEVHLVPDELVVSGIAALKEACQVFFHDVGRRLTAGGYRKSDRAVAGLDFNHQRAEDVDAKTLTALTVFRVTAHRAGDVIVDPMAAFLVVIVAAATSNDQRANLLDSQTHLDA
jgi:hypothetical protein